MPWETQVYRWLGWCCVTLISVAVHISHSTPSGKASLKLLDLVLSPLLYDIHVCSPITEVIDEEMVLTDEATLTIFCYAAAVATCVEEVSRRVGLWYQHTFQLVFEYTYFR